MRNIRGFTVGLVLGLGLALSAAGFAQNTTPTEQDKKAESCAMQTCCCKGDSCSLKDHAKSHSSGKQSEKSGCCCCNGNSCNMEMKHKEQHKQG